MEPKLTDQSEAILAKLREDVLKNRLTDEQYFQVTRALKAYEGMGILGNAVIKAAGFIAAGAVLWNYLPWGTKQ